MRSPSLRARLTVIILAPLLLIAAIAGAWQFSSETQRAEGIFDRGLLSAALAISRDVAISDGDALSPATRALINNTSGGELFYHVFAPDGVFVTGYATPPVLPKSAPAELSEPFYYDARYQGSDVRVLRFQYITTVSEVSGEFNITVWQRADVRSHFVREVAARAFAVIALLVLSVAFVVWFGVGLGLRPLLDLEDAIAKRTPSELEPIRRPVPIEARGLVTTLNALLERVSRRISSKDEFISNAAHQLRNPVAGVLALAEAVQNAPDQAAASTRSAELLQAARQASRLTNQLLSYERAAGSDGDQVAHRISLNAVLREAAHRFETQIADTGIRFQCDLPAGDLQIEGDPVMIKEAVLNLLNNAVVHGGADMTEITLLLAADHGVARLLIGDDGVGIPPEKRIAAISRFGQASDGPGSGLGLAIAARVAANHKGSLQIQDSATGALIQLTFPLAQASQA